MRLVILLLLTSLQFVISSNPNRGYIRINTTLEKLKNAIPQNYIVRQRVCKSFSEKQSEYRRDAKLWESLCQLEDKLPCNQETMNKYSDILRTLRTIPEKKIKTLQVMMKSGLKHMAGSCGLEFQHQLEQIRSQDSAIEASNFAYRLSRSVMMQCHFQLNWCALRGGYRLHPALSNCLKKQFPMSMGPALIRAFRTRRGEQITRSSISVAKAKCEAFVDQYGEFNNLVADAARLANDEFYGSERVCQASLAVEMCKLFLSQRDESLADSMRI